MTNEEVVQEIKDYIDSSNQALLTAIQDYIQTELEGQTEKIRETQIIRETITGNLPKETKGYHK